MKLNEDQQEKVIANMKLVGKVIKDKVHGLNQTGIYSYDDLTQIGYIGLCKAAYTDKGGCFSTYAYRLIWNEICNALIIANNPNWKRSIRQNRILSSWIHRGSLPLHFALPQNAQHLP